MNFLADCFHEGYEYRSIGCIRFAISAHHVHIKENPVGQDPLVGSLMPETFYGRPRKPRYLFVWDVEEVLHFVKVNWGNNIPNYQRKLWHINWWS